MIQGATQPFAVGLINGRSALFHHWCCKSRSLPLSTRSVPLVSLLEVKQAQLRQHSALTYFWESNILSSHLFHQLLCFISDLLLLTSHILNIHALNPPNFSPRIQITSPPELFYQDTEVYIRICQRNVKAEASCALLGLQQTERPTAHNRTVLWGATVVPSQEVGTQPSPYCLLIFDLLDANLLSKIAMLSCAAMISKII